MASGQVPKSPSIKSTVGNGVDEEEKKKKEEEMKCEDKRTDPFKERQGELDKASLARINKQEKRHEDLKQRAQASDIPLWAKQQLNEQIERDRKRIDQMIQLEICRARTLKKGATVAVAHKSKSDGAVGSKRSLRDSDDVMPRKTRSLRESDDVMPRRARSLRLDPPKSVQSATEAKPVSKSSKVTSAHNKPETKSPIQETQTKTKTERKDTKQRPEQKTKPTISKSEMKRAEQEILQARKEALLRQMHTKSKNVKESNRLEKMKARILSEKSTKHRAVSGISKALRKRQDIFQQPLKDKKERKERAKEKTKKKETSMKSGLNDKVEPKREFVLKRSTSPRTPESKADDAIPSKTIEVTKTQDTSLASNKQEKGHIKVEENSKEEEQLEYVQISEQQNEEEYDDDDDLEDDEPKEDEPPSYDMTELLLQMAAIKDQPKVEPPKWDPYGPLDQLKCHSNYFEESRIIDHMLRNISMTAADAEHKPVTTDNRMPHISFIDTVECDEYNVENKSEIQRKTAPLDKTPSPAPTDLNTEQ